MNKWTRPFESSQSTAAPARPRPAPAAHHYFAFVSYSHKDCETADWLHEQLEHFRVPLSLAGRLTANGVIPKRLSPVFRDQHELAASDDLGGEIRQALELSRCLIVLCSPAAAKSKWVNAEVDQFKRIHPEGCIIAAVVAGRPLASDAPGSEDEECFPPALLAKYNRRGQPTGHKAEPLASDLRGSEGERRTGFLKIVAGILGVGLDDLVQRDHTRRQRRLAYLAAASLAGMVVTGGLAVTAIEARDAARDQRRQAEGLVDFMVGDLRQKLEPLGRLDILDGVGSRVLEYYSKQNTADLSDPALLQRSRALNLLARVAFQRGNLQEADALDRQAMAGTAELVRRSPNDAERLFEHAQNVFYVGEDARFSGQPSRSEAAYREYKRIADQMGALEPDNLKYRMEILYAGENIGISLYDQHRFAEAARQFESGLGPMQTLASLYPADLTYQKEIANLLSWVSDSKASQGDLSGAIAARQREASVLQQILVQSNDLWIRRMLVLAYQPLGLMFAYTGRMDSAVDQLRTAVSIADELVAAEPRSADSRRRGASARFELARALLAIGRKDEASTVTAAACATVDALPESDTSSERRSLSNDCMAARARIALADGQAAEALALARRALASTRSELNEDPLKVRYRLAALYQLAGDASLRLGDASAASTAWKTGLGQLPSGVAERPSDMSERLELLRRLGLEKEAAPLAGKLAQMGFHDFT